MESVDDRVGARRANFEYYKQNLGHISELFFGGNAVCTSNRWLTGILKRHRTNREIYDINYWKFQI